MSAFDKTFVDRIQNEGVDLLKNYKKHLGLLLFAALMLTHITSCGVSAAAKNHIYEDFDVKESLGIEFPADAFDFREFSSENPATETAEPNYKESAPSSFQMRVVGTMQIYESPTSQYPCNTLFDGEQIMLTEPEEGGEWATVHALDGTRLGVTKDGFLKAIDADTELYAELPVEYGLAPTNEGTIIEAYSHLVDIRKYLRVYESTDPSNEGVDLSQYDVKVSMKLSTFDTSIGEPFYSRNLCLLQYDTLQKLIKAIDMFRARGYTVVIYDAYRPTSVQQRWFDVIKVHKWVADPSRGMGGIHDRGTAIDMSLIDKDGNELEMPTPMHTFTEASARTSEEMTDTARENMDYMTRVMTSCGFTYINSEWWHFQCRDTKSYLPTDHPIDSIPLIPSENELGR